MYERFTDRARKVMQIANEVARGMGCEYVGTEHVLLALLKEGSGTACSALKEVRLAESAVRDAICKLVPPPIEVVGISEDKLPQSPRVQQAISQAMMAARDMLSAYVGTEHLLLGLLKEDFLAYTVLLHCDVSIEALTEHVMSLYQRSVSIPIERNITNSVASVSLQADTKDGLDDAIEAWNCRLEDAPNTVLLTQLMIQPFSHQITIFYENGT